MSENSNQLVHPKVYIYEMPESHLVFQTIPESDVFDIVDYFALETRIKIVFPKSIAEALISALCDHRTIIVNFDDREAYVKKLVDPKKIYDHVWREMYTPVQERGITCHDRPPID